MRNWLKTVLFISAFSPALLVLAAVRVYSIGSFDVLAIQLAIVSILGAILPFLILYLVSKEAQKENFSAKKVESADYFLLVFLASYAAPVVMKMADISFFTASIVVALMFVVAWFVSNIPSHPMLYLVKFRFYKVESSEGMVYMLITRRIIRSPKDIKQITKISDGMIME